MQTVGVEPTFTDIPIERSYNNVINSFKESKDFMEYNNMGIYTNSDIIGLRLHNSGREN